MPRTRALLAAVTLAALALTGCAAGDDTPPTPTPTPTITTPTEQVTTFNDGALVAVVEPADVRGLTGDVAGVGQGRAARAYAWAVAYQALAMSDPMLRTEDPALGEEAFSTFANLSDEDGARQLADAIATYLADAGTKEADAEMWRTSPFFILTGAQADAYDPEGVAVTGFDGGRVALAGTAQGRDLIEVTVEVTTEFAFVLPSDGQWYVLTPTKGATLTLVDAGGGDFLLHSWADITRAWPDPVKDPARNG